MRKTSAKKKEKEEAAAGLPTFSLPTEETISDAALLSMVANARAAARTYIEADEAKEADLADDLSYNGDVNEKINYSDAVNHLKAVDLVLSQKGVTLPAEEMAALAEQFEVDAALAVQRFKQANPHIDISRSKVIAQRPTTASLLSLPTEISESDKYDNWRKTNGRDVVKFLRTGWPAQYIEAKVLTRPALFRLDESAYDSVSSLRDRGKVLPEDIYLPDRTEVAAKSHLEKVQARRAETNSYVEKVKARKAGKQATVPQKGQSREP